MNDGEALITPALKRFVSGFTRVNDFLFSGKKKKTKQKNAPHCFELASLKLWEGRDKSKQASEANRKMSVSWLKMQCLDENSIKRRVPNLITVVSLWHSQKHGWTFAVCTFKAFGYWVKALSMNWSPSEIERIVRRDRERARCTPAMEENYQFTWQNVSFFQIAPVVSKQSWMDSCMNPGTPLLRETERPNVRHATSFTSHCKSRSAKSWPIKSIGGVRLIKIWAWLSPQETSTAWQVKWVNMNQNHVKILDTDNSFILFVSYSICAANKELCFCVTKPRLSLFTMLQKSS